MQNVSAQLLSQLFRACVCIYILLIYSFDWNNLFRFVKFNGHVNSISFMTHIGRAHTNAKYRDNSHEFPATECS